MSENIFDEFVDWWNTTNKRSNVDYDKALRAALSSIGVLNANEKIIDREVVTDWQRASDEIYESIVTLNIEGVTTTRTVMVAGYAVVTPPGISIEDRIDLWRKRYELLKLSGVNMPDWYLVWRGTIYVNVPTHKLGEYLRKYRIDPFEQYSLAENLYFLLNNLSKLSILPLGLYSSLRTDSFKVYYSGLGFDVGEPTTISPIELLERYELEVLPSFPDDFRKYYLDAKSKNYA